MTQENITFMINCRIKEMASYLIDDDHLTIKEALNIIYNSDLYYKLLDLETGLYYQSYGYCYKALRHEMKYGKVV